MADQEQNASTSAVLTPRGVTWVGLCANAALSAAKVTAGVLCYSQTILADGLHSLSDLTSDVVVLAGLRVSQRPADTSHHYGHRRVGTLVAMFIGAALAAAGVWIAYNAIESIHRPAREVRGYLPLLMAAGSVPIKELLFQITRYVGRRTSNISLLANAWHHRTDAFTSIAATAGLAGVAIGGPEWRFLDPLTAMVLAAFLVVVAARILAFSAEELIDRSPDAATMATIKQAVANTTGVLGYHAIRARKVGGKVAMDIHIQVNPALTVKQGHDIASATRRSVVDSGCDVMEVIVHIEPGDPKAD